MAHYNPELFTALPDGVICTEGELITYLNPAARQIFPALSEGMPLPDAIALSSAGESGTGLLSLGSGQYAFTASRCGQERLILLRPAPRFSFDDDRLDGMLRQLRALTGELLVELGRRTDPEARDFVGADFLKSFHRLFRLVDHADCLQLCQTEDRGIFAPAPLDFAGLVRRLVQPMDELLAKAGFRLTFRCQLPSLLLSGDAALLQRLILELVSNACKAGPGTGEILLSLTRIRTSAVLSVSGPGGAEAARSLADALSGKPAPAIPRPGQGAGLGLALIRRIVALHQGSLMAECTPAAPKLVISLPAGLADSRAEVRSPRPTDTDGGLNPLLVGLADVLPAEVFGQDSLD